jgi:hypothetical protein
MMPTDLNLLLDGMRSAVLLFNCILTVSVDYRL